MKKLIIILTLSLIFSELSYAGKDRGGGLPAKIDEASITVYLESADIKRALLNYIQTVQVDKIIEVELRSTFKRMMSHGELVRDIQTPNNYVPSEKCLDGLGNSVPASTEFGRIGAPICFNVKMLSEEFKNIKSEEAIIRLAALVMHEHVHHFQPKLNDMNSLTLQEYEREAYRVGGYIKLTARFVQIPILEWSDEIKPLDEYRKQLLRASYELQYAKEDAARMSELRKDASLSQDYATTILGGSIGLALTTVMGPAAPLIMAERAAIYAVGWAFVSYWPITIVANVYDLVVNLARAKPEAINLESRMTLLVIEETLARVQFLRGEVNMSYSQWTDFLGVRDAKMTKELSDYATARARLLEMKVDVLNLLVTHEETRSRSQAER